MKFNENSFPSWLDQVKEKLISLNIAGKGCRVYLFKASLVLDEKSWRSYFDEGLLPYQAVKEDLELPWVERNSHTILK